MTASLIILVLTIAVGLPLLAWWIGGRRFRTRLRGRAERDPWGDLLRRYGLSAGEASRLAVDVPRGRRLPDPRLRLAAVVPFAVDAGYAARSRSTPNRR